MTDISERSRHGRKIIVVEGVNDKHVVMHILTRSGMRLDIDIIDRDGLDELLRGIPLLVGNAENRVIGIVVDANDSTIARSRAVLDLLRRVGVNAPASLGEYGTIIPGTDELPRIGIWMMPDNRSPGELEHFVAKMIPDDDPVWPLSQGYIDSIPARHRAFRPQKETRAKVLSWIATREEPGFMGQAIDRRDLRTDGELCQTFIAWLNRLFAVEDSAEDVGQRS